MPVGVTGVMAGDGPSDRIGSLSGLSSDTSSVASYGEENKINQIHHTGQSCDKKRGYDDTDIP